MALRPCLAPDCLELADGSYCEQHRRATRRAVDRRRGDRPWYSDPAYKRARIQALRKTPWCAQCGATKDLTVDHVVPRSLAAGVQVLCRRCNSAKGGRSKT